MRVLYDTHVFNWQKVGGISKYYAELISQLRKDNVDVILPVLVSNNVYLNNICTNVYRLFPSWNNRYKDKFIGRINNTLLDYYYYKGEFDIFHPTYYDLSFLNCIKGKPFVLTVHDMYNEIFCIDSGNVISLKKELINRADRIIAISENTKNDILQIYNIDETKISVVHHGFRAIKCLIKPNIQIESPYVLFVGGRGDYKNFDRFIRAFAYLRTKYVDLNLICTGNPFSQDELLSFRKLNISERVYHCFSTEEELAWLYTNAEFFVFPSLYEGFGLPLLEAFNYGAPSLISDTSCFPEIAENAALYFNPYDIDSMICCMDKFLSSTSLKKCLIERGKLRVKQFSWEKTSEKTNAIYKSLL